jgi:hypothetical protein
LFDEILRKFKECIRTNSYVVTLHGEEKMDEDELSIFDVESAVLTGKIVERQKDTGAGEWKYLIQGRTIDGSIIEIVAKFSQTTKMVIITVYRDEQYD